MMSTSTMANDTSSAGQRFDSWVLERVRQRRGPAELPLTFEYRHIYVMPTRFGLWFGFLLALTALGGLNFNNNMTLMLGFLLAAIAQLTTLLAYRNMAGLRLEAIRAKPVFAGEAACFRILVRNPEERNRFAIEAVSPEARDCKDIGPQNTVPLTLQQLSFQRG